MKKFKTTAICAILSGSLLFSSCIGSFGLWNGLKDWNQGVGTKFVNEIVFLAFNIIPVYGVAYLADILVLNSIEFWSGTNPIEAGTKTVTSDNERYLVAWDNTGYKITNETTGEETRFNFDAGGRHHNPDVHRRHPCQGANPRRLVDNRRIVGQRCACLQRPCRLQQRPSCQEIRP